MIPKIKYQQITYSVNSANEQIVIDAETDKLYSTCTGINILLSYDDAKFSTLQLSINNLEVFPDKFEVIRLLFRGNAPFGFDYHKLNEPAGGSKVKGTYIDSGLSASYPYRITFSLRLENIELTDAGKIA